ncbi:hypothetical protein [Paraburkholderia sp.]|jgi:hypothetical protein|uniref:hypothetical protein n=1 Tax=Paraburkholderia sp. TaxID=1926495 RepID=UPI002F3E8F8C
MLTQAQSIPTIIVSGTPVDVDRYLVSTLWAAAGPHPSVIDVFCWRRKLHERGDDFAPHEAACYYWLCEHKAGFQPWAYPL